MKITGYEVIEEIARSEWHSLNRARRESDRENVLLKVILRNAPAAGGINSPGREFEIISEISMPGVPRAIEMRDGCLVMADDGGTPLQKFRAGQRLSLERFFRVAIQLCAILAELHRRNIIHRGLNPRSILVHSDTYEAQIADFSFASQEPGESQPPGSPHLLGGMLPYISPEQTGRMNRSTDYRTDFYSLGVTFYEILTGVCPFRSEDSLELIHSHIAKHPTSPSETPG